MEFEVETIFIDLYNSIGLKSLVTIIPIAVAGTD